MNAHSYFDFATLDLEWAKATIHYADKTGNYNKIAVDCSQACEKYLKALILTFVDDLGDLRYSHDCGILYEKASQNYNIPVTEYECHMIGSYYYTANYPGEKYSAVSKKECVRAFLILDKLKAFIKKNVTNTSKEPALIDKIVQMTGMSTDRIYSIIPDNSEHKKLPTKEECIISYYKQVTAIFKGEEY